MNNDFVAEILRATGTLRTSDPSGATAIIQAALAAGGLLSSAAAPIASGKAFGMPRAADGITIEGSRVPSAPATAGAPQPMPLRSKRLRKPLGEVLRTLAEGRRGLGLHGRLPGAGRRLSAPALPLPAGAAFHDLHYSCAAGARRYRLYVPASSAGEPQGLIVMLHGCTQDAEDFAAGTRMNDLAEERRLLVVYPAQTNADNAMACWNWFRPGDQLRDRGEPAIIAGLTRHVRDAFGAPHDRVFVAGLSAGGAMAAIMGETYPEIYAGVGVHSGLACGSANDVLSAFSAMRGQSTVDPRPAAARPGGPRVIVFHGSADTTVDPSNAERIVASLGYGHGATVRSDHAAVNGVRGYSRLVAHGDNGVRTVECWIVDGAQHAWSGGAPAGSYTDPQGPDASAAMVRFFLDGTTGHATG